MNVRRPEWLDVGRGRREPGEPAALRRGHDIIRPIHSDLNRRRIGDEFERHILLSGDQAGTACGAYLGTGDASRLLKAASTAARQWLEDMEAAYLDALRRGPVPVLSTAEALPMAERAMREPDALRTEEVAAITQPENAPAKTVCQA
jgi:hypothetical protein